MKSNFIHNGRSQNNLNLSLLSTVFSHSQILKLSRVKGQNQLLKMLLQVPVNLKKSNTIAQSFDSVYKHLFDNYRCEYIYKNEIARQLLLARHPAGEAKLYTEVQIHNSIADVLIVNGTSTVYEIKTELDTFDRLESQISSYKLVFDKIYIVTHPSMLRKLKQKITKDIGIIILSDQGILKTIRKAESNKQNTQPQVIFNLLHKEEYIKIIKMHFGFTPNVQPAYIYNECKKIFSTLAPEVSHNYMLDALRNRKIQGFRSELYKTLPDSLKLLASNNRLTKKDSNKIDLRLQDAILCS